MGGPIYLPEAVPPVQPTEIVTYFLPSFIYPGTMELIRAT
jgi:hypothetical protein